MERPSKRDQGRGEAAPLHQGADRTSIPAPVGPRQIGSECSVDLENDAREIRDVHRTIRVEGDVDGDV